MSLLHVFAGSESDGKAIAESGMLDILNATVGTENYQVHFCSAHRDPRELEKEVQGMLKDGAEVFIGIAGLAAALPGALAGATSGVKKIIAVALDEHGINSCIYLPPGRPAALVGVGKVGLQNAALEAAQLLGMIDEGVRRRLSDYQNRSKLKKQPKFNVGLAPSPTHTGKVRDTYDAGPGQLLQVASDRISVFDVVLGETVPGKGKVLTDLTRFWLTGPLKGVRNHLITTDLSGLNVHLRAIPDMEGRSMVVEKCRMLPLEAIVRGYLFGSVVKEYEAEGTACGIPLPTGLVSGSRLPEPLFTPSTKAEIGAHDENVTLEVGRRILEEAGFAPELFDEVARRSVDIYMRGAAHALERGIIIADTKFEWGVDELYNLVLCDEVLTPDSSRFWDFEAWQKDGTVVQFDKQPVRDHYASLDPKWNKKAPAPPLPVSVVDETAGRYRVAYEIITGPPLTT